MKAPALTTETPSDYSVESAISFRLPSCVRVTKSKGDKPSEPWYSVEAFTRAPFDNPAHSPFVH